MYNKTFICTYQYYDPKFYNFISENFDIDDVKEFFELSEELYRQDIINVLGPNLSYSPEIPDSFKKEILSHIDCIEILYSYDYFFLFHNCVKNDFKIEADIEKLKSALL